MPSLVDFRIVFNPYCRRNTLRRECHEKSDRNAKKRKYKVCFQRNLVDKNIRNVNIKSGFDGVPPFTMIINNN
jgi:hypothetical protein